MPAHSVLISPAQGLPACCATATEPDRSSRVARTTPLGRYKRCVDGAERSAQRWTVLRIAFPPWQELSDVSAALVGCGHVSGLLMRQVWPLSARTGSQTKTRTLEVVR